jgi:hypothetical protein
VTSLALGACASNGATAQKSEPTMIASDLSRVAIAGTELDDLNGVCWLDPESLQTGRMLARVEVTGTDAGGTAYPASLVMAELEQGVQHAVVVGVHPADSIETTNYGQRTFIEDGVPVIDREGDVFSVEGELALLPEGSLGPPLAVSIRVDCSS